MKAKAFFGTHAGTATVRRTVAILRIAFFESLFFTSKKEASKMMLLFCEDKTIEMFLRFRCLDLNTRHNHSTSLRFCFQGCLQRHLDFSLQRHLDFSAADKDHLDFLF